MKTKLTIITLFLSLFTLHAQNTYTSKVLDSLSQKPIEYASIFFNSKNGVITNANGEFNITIKQTIKPTDSLVISCLGYEEKRIALLNFNEDIIYLQQKVVDLSEVVITNKEYTVDEIIEKIKEGFATNYHTNYAKRKLFFRESYYTELDKGEVNLKKSTIPEFNQKLIDSLIDLAPKNTSSHTELLGELYGKVEANQPQKMEVLKAARLYDKTADINFENYEKRFNEIFRKYIKRDSYFKIKSGWFSTKEEIDSSLFGDEKKQENKATEVLVAQQKKRDSIRKVNFLKYRKANIHKLENDNFIDEDNDLNFIHKSNRYEFEILDYAFINDNFAYVIAFKPKRREDWSGTMYVDTEDFAIVRLDYKNVKPLRKFGLLGISLKEYLKEGTMIFQKNDNEKYSLKYMDETFGQQVGIKRPIKIVEKNKNVKGRRKQNELNGDFHFIVKNIEKIELIVFETNLIAETDFKNFKENPKVKPTYLSKYDPEFWKGYNIIEPNQIIRDFKAIEN
ncbi:carboxypeptidase-like regulatory domain-containing protein [Winogradskyella immobilis]|uniref:Carboxypeptidase-like regulatory domain-containing protein n=1 Tax=Winogradskyella immobilis TaxID=2816852 RepID=A0ABS8EKP1_9FLAO|nr:carboxypeptidase-like regulatory domain-containing protein [Winogradskyella immobilis]MCC1483140.1 carboxypeptidase-like regulatory domain-containing protein [Winogradskyella immobilis]MCG0015235.1 carboxypeptidase-like regulatory domain-containing protein [Winogradskyella immobilis]